MIDKTWIIYESVGKTKINNFIKKLSKVRWKPLNFLLSSFDLFPPSQKSCFSLRQEGL